MELDGLEARMTALESEVRDFRRATVASFNAMREDLVSMRKDMAGMQQDAVSTREYMYALRGDMDNGFIEMRGKFDMTAAGQQQIVKLLEGLIADQG